MVLISVIAKKKKQKKNIDNEWRTEDGMDLFNAWIITYFGLLLLSSH